MTRSDYYRALTEIEERNPGEVLLPSLRKGFSIVNVAYMAAALGRLPAPADVVPDEDELLEVMKVDNDDLRRMWAERSKLFLEMNKASNAFHDCKSDEERRLISQKVRKIWDQIERVKGQIEYYQENGAAPDEDQEERFPLPTEPVALMKKLNSIRAQISQTQKRLDVLGELPDGHPDREKISEIEAKLAELKLYRGHAEHAVKQASVHAAGL